MFCEANGIVHTLSPPYHPQSNGLAERCVGIVKSNLKKFILEMGNNNGSIESQIQNFLFKHRNSPLSSGKCPSEIMLSFKPKTNLFHLQSSKNVEFKAMPKTSVQAPLVQSTKKEWKCPSQSRATSKAWTTTSGNTTCKYKTDDEVMVLSRHGPTNWVSGKIVNGVSPSVYKVKLYNNRVISVHVDSLRKPFKKSYRPTYFQIVNPVPETPSHVPRQVQQTTRRRKGRSRIEQSDRILRARREINYKD